MHFRQHFAILGLLLIAAPARAQEPTPLQILAPYLDDDSILIGQIDIANVDLDAIFARIRKIGFERAELDGLQKSGQRIKDRLLETGVKRVYFTNVGNPLQFDLLFVAPAAKPQAAADVIAELNFKTRLAGATALFGSASALDRSSRRGRKANPEWPGSLAMAGAAPSFAVFLPPRVLLRAYKELQPELPKELGGGSTAALADSFQSASIAIDLAGKVNVDIIVQMKDDAGAKRLEVAFDRLLAFLKTNPDSERMRLAATLIESQRPKQTGDRFQMSLDDNAFDKMLIPLVAHVREGAMRSQATNNLKQINLAMHNFHDVNKHLPPQASSGKDGKPLLSWRVQLLPFMNEMALYKEFHHDEPWDSEHNKQLISKMPRSYLSPLSRLAREDGKTTFVVPAGPKLVFNGTQTKTVLREISDGTVNTIMTLDVDDSKAVIWTKPEDYQVDQKTPNVGHFRPSVGRILAGLCDGSVAWLSPRTSDEVLWRLFCPNDGHLVQMPYAKD